MTSPLASNVLVRQQRAARNGRHRICRAGRAVGQSTVFSMVTVRPSGTRRQIWFSTLRRLHSREIVVALVPPHFAVFVANALQRPFDMRKVVGERRRQHHFAISDAIEGVVAHHEPLRCAGPPISVFA